MRVRDEREMVRETGTDRQMASHPSNTATYMKQWTSRDLNEKSLPDHKHGNNNMPVIFRS